MNVRLGVAVVILGAGASFSAAGAEVKEAAQPAKTEPAQPDPSENVKAGEEAQARIEMVQTEHGVRYVLKLPRRSVTPKLPADPIRADAVVGLKRRKGPSQAPETAP